MKFLKKPAAAFLIAFVIVICSTLWSVVYNNTKRTFTVCPMFNYDKPFRFSVSEPLKMLG